MSLARTLLTVALGIPLMAAPSTAAAQQYGRDRRDRDRGLAVPLQWNIPQGTPWWRGPAQGPRPWDGRWRYDTSPQWERSRREHTANRLATTANQLVRALENAGLPPRHRNVLIYARRFARAADDFQEALRVRRVFPRAELHRVQNRWRQLDRRLSELAPRRPPHSHALALRIDRYVNLLSQ